MNDTWKRIFCDWITDSEAIKHLFRDGIIDEEQQTELKEKLLHEIIETIKSEVGVDA